MAIDTPRCYSAPTRRPPAGPSGSQPLTKEYRRLRFYGVMRVAAGSLAAIAGFICLAYNAYGWAAFFLVVAALDIAWGYWDLGIDRSART
jgi:hypothetical protein